MKEKIKTIKIIHLALCLGLIIIYAIVGDINSLINFSFENLNGTNSLFLLIPIFAYLLSNFLYNRQLKNIDPNLSLEEKFPFYQSASLIRWAVIEGAAFLLLFLNKDFMFYGMLLILYLLFIRPTEDNIKMALT
ncbi:MFS transporter [Bizionia arctica]|uniref:Uncharacterized protein n=1 Tax=Bizionia arctica TaxID=1495645 RepID=A0A917LM95_9FLAO|nr:MFS transporter [Bizionia arctica]GGG44225.1 hypothetical protein GCM10010976_14790 [Bizionia arctica]